MKLLEQIKEDHPTTDLVWIHYDDEFDAETMSNIFYGDMDGVRDKNDQRIWESRMYSVEHIYGEYVHIEEREDYEVSDDEKDAITEYLLDVDESNPIEDVFKNTRQSKIQILRYSNYECLDNAYGDEEQLKQDGYWQELVDEGIADAFGVDQMLKAMANLTGEFGQICFAGELYTGDVEMGKVPKTMTIHKGQRRGLLNPWNGYCDMFDQVLLKDITISIEPTNNITCWSVEFVGATRGYDLDNICGYTGGRWAQEDFSPEYE